MFSQSAKKPLAVALGLWALWVEPGKIAAKEPSKVTAQSVALPDGIHTFAETVLEAPADKVAALLSSPTYFVPLFPAHRVDVIKEEGDKVLIAIEMRKPWPIGSVKWMENVVSFEDTSNHAFIVDRDALPGYFRRLRSRWRVEPLSSATQPRCRVTYDVTVQLSRWVPEWILRRNHLGGVKETMERLRDLVQKEGLVEPMPKQTQK